MSADCGRSGQWAGGNQSVCRKVNPSALGDDDDALRPDDAGGKNNNNNSKIMKAINA